MSAIGSATINGVGTTVGDGDGVPTLLTTLLLVGETVDITDEWLLTPGNPSTTTLLLVGETVDITDEWLLTLGNPSTTTLLLVGETVDITDEWLLTLGNPVTNKHMH